MASLHRDEQLEKEGWTGQLGVASNAIQSAARLRMPCDKQVTAVYDATFSTEGKRAQQQPRHSLEQQPAEARASRQRAAYAQVSYSRLYSPLYIQPHSQSPDGG